MAKNPTCDICGGNTLVSTYMAGGTVCHISGTPSFQLQLSHNNDDDKEVCRPCRIKLEDTIQSTINMMSRVNLTPIQKEKDL